MEFDRICVIVINQFWNIAENKTKYEDKGGGESTTLYKEKKMT